MRQPFRWHLDWFSSKLSDKVHGEIGHQFTNSSIEVLFLEASLPTSRDAIVFSIEKCSKLRKLSIRNIEYCEMKGEDFRDLEEIDISYGVVTLKGDFPSLRSLDLHGLTFSDKTAFTAPNLRSLTFNWLKNSSRLMCKKPFFPMIRELRIGFYEIYDNDFMPVQDHWTVDGSWRYYESIKLSSFLDDAGIKFSSDVIICSALFPRKGCAPFSDAPLLSWIPVTPPPSTETMEHFSEENWS